MYYRSNWTKALFGSLKTENGLLVDKHLPSKQNGFFRSVAKSSLQYYLPKWWWYGVVHLMFLCVLDFEFWFVEQNSNPCVWQVVILNIPVKGRLLTLMKMDFLMALKNCSPPFPQCGSFPLLYCGLLLIGGHIWMGKSTLRCFLNLFPKALVYSPVYSSSHSSLLHLCQ